VGNSVVLAENVSGGVWSCSNASAMVSSAGLVTGVTEGMDTVVYTVSNAWCSAAAELAVKVMGLWDCGALATPTVLSGGQVNIWPNPVSNELHIDNGANSVVSIFDLLGQKVFSSIIISNKAIVDIGQLIPGVYVVEIDQKGIARITKRLVVAR
jgi:hypothetical protein